MSSESTPRIHRRTFRGPQPGPRLLVTGGVHGDEFEPILALLRLIAAFDDRHSAAPLRRGTVVLVPLVNEAAFQRGSRTAEDGLDLARTCPGDFAGSITERTAAVLSDWIRAADYYIDLHTGGTELSVLPLAGYMMHADPGVLSRQREMARAFNLPFVWGTSAMLDGRSLSVARDAQVPAIYAEYLGSATCTPAGVQAYVDGCLNVMAWLSMVDERSSESRVTRILEDTRPQAGHMQICHPAPISGLFEPAVRLGELVADGQTIGRVSPVDGASATTLAAEHGGIVLVLRTLARVRQGDSLAVIAATGGRTVERGPDE